MPDTSAISVQQLLRTPLIGGLYSQMGGAGRAMTAYYGLGLNAAADRRFPTRDVVFDVFNNTRTLAQVRSPGAGPSQIRRQRVGTTTAVGIRTYESRPFTYDELNHFRPMGKPQGVIDRQGQSYVAKQMAQLVERCMNTREFCFNRMLKGGFSVLEDGDDIRLAEAGTAGAVPVDYQLPAAHKGQLALLPDGADGGSDPDPVIDGPWSDANTDIAKQMLTLSHISAYRSGLPITDIWINSIVYQHLLNNTSLQRQGGSVFKVFDTITRQELQSPGPGGQLQGASHGFYDVKLRAIPQYTFHVYDGGSIVGTDTDPSPSNLPVPASDSGWTPFLKDDEAIITPPPKTGWYGLGTIKEVIQEQYASQAREVYGMHTYTRKQIDPVPAIEARVLDNFVMMLFIPNAVYYATIDF